MGRRWIIAGIILTAVLLGALHVSRGLSSYPFDGDAADYNRGAIHLLSQGFYSFDGIRPTVEREPGQSVYLALQYLLVGVEHPLRVFVLQAVITFLASLMFCIQLKRITSIRAAGITFLLLLTSGSILHATTSLVRESLALSILLLCAAAYLADAHSRRWVLSVAMGVLLGILILTYYPFVYFVVPFAILWLWDRRGFSRLAVVLICIALIVGGWMLRNERSGAGAVIIGGARANVMWYVRGEQAERVRGAEPFLCLRAEYISRDWTHRSDACSFNALMHLRWPEGVAAASVADLEAAGRSGRAKILQHPFSYLWFSVFEILELHLPYVGGGVSHAFNLYIAIMTAVLYAGMALGWKSFLNRRFAILLLLPFYTIAAFSLTDAIPRYLVPVLFCYCTFAGIGFDRVLPSKRSP